MSKKIISLSAVIILLCLLVSACYAESPKDEADNTPAPSETTDNSLSPNDIDPPKTGKASAVNFEIESSLKNNYESEVSEFDLGSGTYKAQSGREMPYKVRGIIGVPVGAGPFPVVFITHGSHENLDETKRFDTGFEYLVRALAQNGYIAVSMDMIAPYIWKYGDGDEVEKSAAVADEHIKSILSANSGDALYPIELTGKVNAEKIALIGHSRGGEAIFYIADEQREKGVNIETLLSIAPSWDTMRVFPDVSAAILVPQYDGDVVRLDGIALYDYLAGRTNGDHSVTFLIGANHNFFNRNIEKNDSTAQEVENGYPPLSREEQENFLVNFAIDFFDSSFGIEDRYYQLSQSQPNKMYGQTVSRRIHRHNAVELIDAGTSDAFSSDDASVRHVVDSWFFQEDDILIDTVTIGILDENLNTTNLNRNLIGIEWKNIGSSVKIVPLITNFTDKKALSINIVPDSASDMKKTDRALRFTVLIRDMNGNASAVTVPEDQFVLKNYPGKLDKTDLIDSSIEYWIPSTPLGSLNIPLALFEDVNLASIASIEFLFDHDDSGAVFIDSVNLQ